MATPLAFDWDHTSFVFVLGTGRCGSTLVQEVLARHPGAGFVSNIEDNIPLLAHRDRWNSSLYRQLPVGLTRKGRIRYAPSEAYDALRREVSPIVVDPFRDLLAGDVTPWLERRFGEFFTSRVRAQGKPVYLHKFTGWPRAGFIQRVFPQARFIHVVRDGRAVANSWLQMDWWRGYQGPSRWQWGPLTASEEAEWLEEGRSFPALAAILWKILIRAFDAAAARLPAESWLEVRYEDVVADPGRAFDAMLRFSGLAPDAGFDRALGRYAFSAERGEAFQHELAPADLASMTRVLSEDLARRGYTAR
ncbi:MAG: sulfotransferase family protein [Candidatus Dormibacterales bacterium]